jgi:hypothetical protein
MLLNLSFVFSEASFATKTSTAFPDLIALSQVRWLLMDNKKERILQLIEQLSKYSYEYYMLDKPSISDIEFDTLFDELKKLESETGFIMSNSPTQKVGSEVLSKLEKVEHKIALKSLDKTKSVQDVIKFAKGRELVAMLKADGLTDEEISRPLIAVINSANEVIPGHLMLDHVASAVKAGILMAGGTPLEISTIGVCDGIAMNHEGMRYSLVSREVIADSVEIAVAAHAFDAVVMIPNCDKVIPGMLMAAARLDLPTIVISGGPMLAGRGPQGEAVDLDTVFTAVGKVNAGTMSEADLCSLEENACPTCGSCAGLFTANSMNCLTEETGLDKDDQE